VTDIIKANGGIGFELVRQLLAKGTYHVLLGARSSQKGIAALQELEAHGLPGTVEFVPLDLQDDDTIAGVTESITQTHGKLDLLVNNAAIAFLAGKEREQLRAAFDTNATGPYLLTEAVAPLLRKSANPRIINVSSGVGSLTRRLNPDSPTYKQQSVSYRASKAALNMITACQYVEYGLGFQAPGAASGGVKVFAFCPGFTVSNLSEMNKKENGAKSTEESANNLMDIIEGKRDADVGKFVHGDGVYPW
jgi:NAD(P)-dependent dehydrogenase (short-subunit alcohol dehydrogenase family)